MTATVSKLYFELQDPQAINKTILFVIIATKSSGNTLIIAIIYLAQVLCMQSSVELILKVQEKRIQSFYRIATRTHRILNVVGQV